MKIVHNLTLERPIFSSGVQIGSSESQVNDEAANSEAEDRLSCYECICMLHNACKNVANS